MKNDTVTLLSFDQWVKEYKPVLNNITDTAPFDGCLHETFGAEHNTILDFKLDNPNHVWTLIEEGGIQLIESGYHVVNRLGYFMTEKGFAGDVDVTLND